MSDPATPAPDFDPKGKPVPITFAPPFPEIDKMSKEASNVIQVMGNSTGYSLMELAALFRTAAGMCDEMHGLNERIHFTRRLRGPKPFG